MSGTAEAQTFELLIKGAVLPRTLRDPFATHKQAGKQLAAEELLRETLGEVNQTAPSSQELQNHEQLQDLVHSRAQDHGVWLHLPPAPRTRSPGQAGARLTPKPAGGSGPLSADTW